MKYIFITRFQPERLKLPINGYNLCTKLITEIDNLRVDGNAPLESNNLVENTLTLYYLKGCELVKLIEISVNYSAIEIV